MDSEDHCHHPHVQPPLRCPFLYHSIPVFFSPPSRFSHIKIINSRCQNYSHTLYIRQVPFRLPFDYCCIDLRTFLRSHIIQYTPACCCPLHKRTLISPIYRVDVEHRFEFGFDLAFMTLPYDINRSELDGCFVRCRGSIWSPVVPHIFGQCLFNVSNLVQASPSLM